MRGTGTTAAIILIFIISSILVYASLESPTVEELESLGASELAEVLENSLLLRGSYVGLLFSSLPLIVDLALDSLEHMKSSRKTVCWYGVFHLRSGFIVFNLVAPLMHLLTPYKNQPPKQQDQLAESGMNAFYYVCLNLVSMQLVLVVTVLSLDSLGVVPRPLLIAVVTFYGAASVLEAQNLIRPKAYNNVVDMDVVRESLTALTWVCFVFCTFIWFRHLWRRLKGSSFSFDKLELQETEIVTLTLMWVKLEPCTPHARIIDGVTTRKN